MGKKNGKAQAAKYATFRLTPDLKEQIREQAKRNRRTMKAEVEILIELGLQASAAK